MIRNIVAGFLSTVFVLVSTPFAFIWGVYATFTDENFYLGDEFIDLSYKVIVEELPKSVKVTEFEGVDSEDISALVAEVVTREDLKGMWADLVEQVKTAEVTENSTVEFNLSLSWLTAKSDVIAEGLSTLLVENLPKCEKGVALSEDNLKCIPAEMDSEQFVAYIRGILNNEILVDIPDELAFDVNMPAEFKGNISEFFSRVMGMFVIAVSMFLLLLLALIWLVVFRPWYRVLRWEMKTVFSASMILTFFMVLLLKAPDFFNAGDFVTGVNVSADLVGRIFDLLFGTIAGRLLYYSAPVAVLSCGLWIYAFLAAKKEVDVAKG